MKTKQEQINFLVKDLKTYKIQSSWDWDAELRFAVFCGDEKAAEGIREAMRSTAPSCFPIAYVNVIAKASKARRLARLREMSKQGIVQASWVGLGAGGVNEWGVNRVRSYTLKENVA